MSISPELANEIANTVAGIKALREFTGEAIAVCRQALEKANGDPLLAVGLMQASGQLVNVRGSREERDMRIAKSYAEDLELDAEGKIGRRKPGSAPRRASGFSANLGVCSIKTKHPGSPSDNTPREIATALKAQPVAQPDTPMHDTTELAAALAVTAEKVKILRDFTGEGMMDCRNKLGQANGDLLLAVGLLKVSGQLVNYKGNRADRDMAAAKSYAAELEIGLDGTIKRKAADLAPRRPSGWGSNPDFCSIEK